MSSEDDDNDEVWNGRVRGPSLNYELQTVVDSEDQLQLLYEEGSLLHLMKTQRTRGMTTHLYCSHRANGCNFSAKLMYADTSLEVMVMTANAHNHGIQPVQLKRADTGLTMAQRDRTTIEGTAT